MVQEQSIFKPNYLSSYTSPYRGPLFSVPWYTHQVDEVPFADLRAEFRADFSELQACLLQEAKPKTLRPPNHRAAAIGPSVILREPCLAVQFSVHTFYWFVSLRATL